MTKALSAGFDVAAVISEAAVNRMFQVGYHAGLMPQHASTTFEHLGDEHALELHFLPPSLQFVVLAGHENAVRVRFPFLAQVPTLNAQGAAAVAVLLTAVKDTGFDENNQEVEQITLDFSVAPASQYQVEPEPLPATPAAAGAAFSALPESITHGVAATLAADVLAAGIGRLPITPEINSGFGFFAFLTYVDEGFTLPTNGTPYVLPRTLGAYANLTPAEREAPTSAPLTLWQRAESFGPHAGTVWSEQDDMRIAVPVELVHERIRQARAAQGVADDDLPAPMPDDDTIVLNELQVTLGDGRLVVEGNATKVIEDGPDPDADFRLELGLSIEDGALQTVVLDKEFDLPWWADVLPYFLPFLGSTIVHALRIRMAGETGSIGGLAEGLVAGTNTFGDHFPGVALAPVTIDNDGPIDVRPDGLILRGRIRSTIPPSESAGPTYVFGHRFSHEFHSDRAGCPYQAKLKWTNTILFLSPAAALSQGFNGCRVCYPEYDSDASGRVILYFRMPSPPSPPPELVPATLRFERLDPVEANGAEVVPRAEFERAYATHLGDGGDLFFQEFGLPDLLPGAWRLDVQTAAWSTSVDVLVKRWGKYTGKNTLVTFTTGVDGGNVAYGAKPDYPSS